MKATLTEIKEDKILSRGSAGSTKNAFFLLVIIFVFSIFSLAYVYSKFPEVEEAEKVFFKLPRNIEDAKSLGVVLSRYKDMYYMEVLGGVFITYVL